MALPKTAGPEPSKTERTAYQYMMPMRSSGVNCAGSRSSHGKSDGFHAERLAFSYSAARDSVLTGHSSGKMLGCSISGGNCRPSLGIMSGGMTMFGLLEPFPAHASAALASTTLAILHDLLN